MKVKTLLLISTILVGVTLLGNNFQLAKAAQGAEEDRLLEILSGQVPTVDIAVSKDSVKGWNLETRVKNFRFAPENVNTKNNPGEGHAHIYLNGKKMTRLYSSWFHLENLPPGRNKITVGLKSNTHETLVHNSQKIADTEVIEVTPPTK